MHIIGLTLSLLSTFTTANPIPPDDRPGLCVGDFSWHYDTEVTRENVQGEPVVGSLTCIGTNDCTLGAGVSFATAATVSIGFDLGLDLAKIAGSAGISASVSWTEESGKTATAEKHCPEGPWGCSLVFWPSMTEVSGTRYYNDAKTCRRDKSTEEPFKILYPEKDEQGLYGGLVDLCTCQNMDHKDDPGHYDLDCPQDCNGGVEGDGVEADESSSPSIADTLGPYQHLPIIIGGGGVSA
ncbi:MAG: hypothetical protein Q9207_004532 [Kuettlingeria erythrocarpa]